MSRGIHALDVRDQAAVREWLRLEELAAGCRPAPRWPLLHMLAFAAGLLIGWCL